MSNSKIFMPVVIVCITGVAFTVVTFKKFHIRDKSNISNQFTVEAVQALGKLVVMNAALKEITTAEIRVDSEGHTLGKPKKAAYVITFNVEFTYDLKNGPLSITVDTTKEVRTASVSMPPVDIVYSMKDFVVYDEQDGSWFGLTQELTTEEKNGLIQQAKQQAFEQAKSFITQYKEQYESSAAATLKALGTGFGIKNVQVTFQSAPAEKALGN